MTDMTLEQVVEQKYFRSYGETFVVIEAVKVKTAVTNVFIDGICYRSYLDTVQRTKYIRSLVDFLDHFVPFEIFDNENNEN